MELINFLSISIIYPYLLEPSGFLGLPELQIMS